MPVVHPAEVWKESGRYAKIGPELVRFKDRGERDMVLAMTHEEVVALLLRDIVQSYRQLPMIVYHFQTKFRDEPRSRGGLIRVREFVMKDSYSCDLDDAGLDVSYQEHRGAYKRIFRAAGPGRHRGAIRRRDDGRQRARTSSWSSTRSARTRSCCATAAASPTTSRSRWWGSPTPRRRISSRWRTSRPRTRPRSIRSRRPSGSRGRRPPRPRSSSPATAGSSLPSSAATTTSTRPSSSTSLKARRWPSTGDRRGDHRARHGGGLRLADRCAGRRRRRRRAGRPLAEPRGGCEPGRLARAERERAPRLHPRPHRRDHQRPRGRSLPQLRQRRSCCATGIEVGNIFKLGTDLHGGLRVDVPGRGRRAPPHRHGLATGSGSGATSPASSRPTTTRRGSSGRPRSPRTPPTWWPWARSREPRVTEVAEAALRGGRRRRPRPRDPVRRPRRIPRRQADRRRAAGDALDPDGRPRSLAGRRHRGHEPGHRRAERPPDRGRQAFVTGKASTPA